MNTTNEKIIEVEVTKEDLEQMKTEGVSEKDLPEIGIKRYRPSRHILKDKGKITLLIDSEVLEHFEKRAEKENSVSCQTQINQELRRIMERDRKEEKKHKEGHAVYSIDTSSIDIKPMGKMRKRYEYKIRPEGAKRKHKPVGKKVRPVAKPGILPGQLTESLSEEQIVERMRAKKKIDTGILTRLDKARDFYRNLLWAIQSSDRK